MNLPSESIKKALGPGERVLWSGQPRQGVYLRSADIMFVPFSVLWGGFAIFWEYSVVTLPSAPLFMALFGIPFVAVGLYLIVGRFFIEARQRANTHYAVTSQRIIIVSGLFSQGVKSLNLRTLSDLSLTENGSNYGSIFFGGGSPFSFMFRGFSSWPGMGSQLGPHFDQIQGARSVYEMIRNAQQAA
ncbi:PH domain-containing protein [Nevskia sp.]|uniref:PH domain-containing protein n=1 Tax=Nevskia sp. TaxID=1929292 RepID=UPI003F6F8DC9